MQAIEPKMFLVDEQKSITTASVINKESTQLVETPQRKRPRNKSKSENDSNYSCNRNASDATYEKSESSEKKKSIKAVSYHFKRYVPQKNAKTKLF
jgi:hypothetical protein